MYNYDTFPLDADGPLFDAFWRDVRGVGEKPPSGVVQDLDSGDTIKLASKWGKTPLILEFGSFS